MPSETCERALYFYKVFSQLSPAVHQKTWRMGLFLITSMWKLKSSRVNQFAHDHIAGLWWRQDRGAEIWSLKQSSSHEVTKWNQLSLSSQRDEILQSWGKAFIFATLSERCWPPASLTQGSWGGETRHVIALCWALGVGYVSFLRSFVVTIPNGRVLRLHSWPLSLVPASES